MLKSFSIIQLNKMEKYETIRYYYHQYLLNNRPEKMQHQNKNKYKKNTLLEKEKNFNPE